MKGMKMTHVTVEIVDIAEVANTDTHLVCHNMRIQQCPICEKSIQTYENFVIGKLAGMLFIVHDWCIDQLIKDKNV